MSEWTVDDVRDAWNRFKSSGHDFDFTLGLALRLPAPRRALPTLPHHSIRNMSLQPNVKIWTDVAGIGQETFCVTLGAIEGTDVVCVVHLEVMPRHQIGQIHRPTRKDRLD